MATMLVVDKSLEQKLMTVEEALQLSTVNRRFELVRGVYIEMAPASVYHGVLANNISFLITQHVKKNRLGEVTAAETGFLLSRDPDTVRAADVGFISAARIPAAGVPQTGYWHLAPDLAVEVVSPNDDPDDIQEKLEEYLNAGTKMVWVIYPKRKSVAVYRTVHESKILRGEEKLLGEDVLLGFECKVREIFE
ncbi:MAG: Uma2 family endonuclease [Chloroflexi bacterium]|nr:Uma2 family endonuclease [Chloroflexota bacterium]